MAEAIVSAVLERLTSTIAEEIRQEVGVDDKVERLQRKLRLIKAVLLDAEQKQVEEEAVGVWLDQLKDAAYDMEDVLDEWQTARLELNDEGDHEDALVSKKVCRFLLSCCYGFKQVFLRHDIAQKIRKLNVKIDALEREKNNYSLNVIESIGKQGRETTSLDIDVSDICGRDTEKKDLLSMILGGSSEAQEGTRIIAIVGSGGMGKTTLAQFAYNNKEVIGNNFDKRIWVCVSDPFEKLSVAKAILEALDGNAPNLNQLDSLMQRIHDRIQGMKFLLVLDDIWTEDYNRWEPFYNCLRKGLHGSTILITARNKNVACMMKADHFINLEKLSTEDSWLMFKRIAISGRANEEHERLDEIGKKIVEKCDGLPLAIKAIGKLLRSKETREQWEFILNNEMWELGEVKKDIYPALLLSYYNLPPEVKSCFLYCAIFPKDWKFDRNKLTFLWMAQGYLGSNEDKDLEMIGNECFNTLVSRSFFQEVKNDYENNTVICKMHDIMHDVAIFLSQHECFTVESNNSGTYFNRDRLIRHLWERTPKLTVYPDLPKLRSLFLFHNSHPPNFFDQFNHLKAFTFSLPWFKKIPREIGRLRQLKFLDISSCSLVKELSDALFELYNLQTLIACPYVKRISKRIGKLVKLRHLILDKDRTLAITPRGIGRLTSLRTLTAFVIDGGYDNKPCNLECLKNLNHLGGHLSIGFLGNLTDPREVEKAELGNKKNLLGLVLSFDRSSKLGEKASDHNDQNDLLEAIQPHPNLESLKIDYYKGSHVLPEWMMSLCKIKNLYLSRCKFGGRLPSLGKLPYLESLSINISSVIRVSNEFLGIESIGESSSSSKVISFPKLKFLQFRYMYNWKVWDYGITRKDDEEFTIMPHLRTLKFYECPLLKELPEDLFQRTTLEELEVEESSQILMERFEEWKMRRQTQGPSTSN